MQLVLDRCRLDLERGIISYLDGSHARLTDIERRLLLYLASNVNRDISSSALYRDVWGYADSVNTRAATRAVYRLRRKIEEDPSDPTHLITVYNVGFRLWLSGTERSPTAEPARGSAVSGPTPRPEAAPRALMPLRPPLIGREAALEKLRGILDGSARLVTVCGLGGVGKTLLVCQLLQEREGAVFCDLSAARDASSVMARIAHAVNGKAPSTPTVALLQRYDIRLMVLDNVDHLQDVLGEMIEGWLTGCLQLQVVLTSRAPMSLVGGQRMVLGPMSVEDGMALFMERLREYRPRVVLDQRQRSLIREIVERVDRIPLAIELAASRARAVPLSALLVRLKDRFQVLRSDGAHPERQGAIWTILHDTWASLDALTQAGLSSCSIFQGAFSLADVEAVLPGTPERVFESLEVLIDSGLIDLGEDEHYRMLDTVREFSSAQLTGRARHEALKRHACRFAALGSPQALRALDTHGGSERRKALLSKLPDLLLACRWAISAGESDLAFQTFEASWQGLRFSRMYAQALALATSLLELPDLPLHVQVTVQIRHGLALSYTNRSRDGLLMLQQAHAAALASSDAALHGLASNNLASLLKRTQNYDGALQCYSEAVAFYEEAGDPHRAARAALNLAGVLAQKDRKAATVRCRAALEIVYAHGDLQAVALGHQQLSAWSVEVCDYAEAIYQLEQAISISEQAGKLDDAASHRKQIAFLLLVQQQFAAARRFLERAERFYLKSSDQLGQAEITTLHGNLALFEDRLMDARRHAMTALRFHRQLSNQYVGPALNNLAYILWNLGHQEEAVGHYLEALEWAQRFRSVVLEVVVLSKLGLLRLERRELESAAERLDQAVAKARAHSLSQYLGVGLAYRAYQRGCSGDIAASRADRLESAVLMSPAEGMEGWFIARCMSGMAAVLTGDLDDARAALSDAQQRALPSTHLRRSIRQLSAALAECEASST